MITAQLADNEGQRLEALHRLQILDTESEGRFDRLTELASVILGTPIALVSLVDRDRQWFKSKVGMDIDETSRDVSFCAHAIVDPIEPFIVEDALLDERFADNPHVAVDDGVRFYAGQVLHDRDGYAIGTLCAVDTTPRQLTQVQREALELLGKLAEAELHRRSEIELLAELDRSERTKALILNNMTEGVMLQDASGTIVEWNPAAERLLGVSGDQIEGRTPNDARWSAVRRDGTPFPIEDRPSTRVLRGEKESTAVLGVDHPDGHRVWFRIKAQQVLDIDGQLAHVLATFTDITAEIHDAERNRELESALRASEQTARVSLNALEQGVVLANPQTGIIHRINPAAQQILGRSSDELSSMWRDDGWQTFDESGAVLAPDECPIGVAQSSGRPVIGQVIGWRRSDGRRILLRMSCIPGVDDGNMVIAFTDITADHLARRLLDATLETAPVGLAILDLDRTILRCNTVFARQAGRSPKELVGVDVVSLLDDEQQPAATSIGLDIRRGKATTGQLDQRIIRPDGSEIWVNTHLAVIPDLDRPMTIAATFDVTEQRRMLMELSRFGYLFEHANDIILIMGPTGEVIYVSPSVERVLGYPPDFSYLDGVLAMVHPDDLSEAATELSRFVAGTRASSPFTARIRSFTGEWRSMECVAVNLLAEPAVGGIMLTARDTTERVQLAQQLAHQASHDALTGLPNRQMLEQRLEQSLARSARNKTSVGVCFLDLDGFKSINDSFGHAAGDDLLIRVAGVLQAGVRVSDTAARIGGDEFVLVLDPISNIDQAFDVARRVRDSVLDLRVPFGAAFGSSFGLALSDSSDTVASILRRADEALYLAKVTRDSSIEIAPGIGHPVGR